MKNKRIIIGIVVIIFVISAVLSGFLIKSKAAKAYEPEEKTETIYALRGRITKIGEEFTDIETEDGSGWTIGSDRVSVAQFLKGDIIVVISDVGTSEIWDDEIVAVS